MLYEDNVSTQIVIFYDADWETSPIDRPFTSGYCVAIGENLVSLKKTKKCGCKVSRAEVEYRIAFVVMCEFIWIKQLLRGLKFGDT